MRCVLGRSGTIEAVDVAPEPEHRPRSERDAAFLKRYDKWMQLPIIVSAVLPLVIVPESNGWVGRPSAQWPRLEAGRSDDLAGGP
jgi:hypothetical protein